MRLNRPEIAQVCHNLTRSSTFTSYDVLHPRVWCVLCTWPAPGWGACVAAAGAPDALGRTCGGAEFWRIARWRPLPSQLSDGFPSRPRAGRSEREKARRLEARIQRRSVAGPQHFCRGTRPPRASFPCQGRAAGGSNYCVLQCLSCRTRVVCGLWHAQNTRSFVRAGVSACLWCSERGDGTVFPHLHVDVLFASCSCLRHRLRRLQRS